jgi:hypothetical protein
MARETWQSAVLLVCCMSLVVVPTHSLGCPGRPSLDPFPLNEISACPAVASCLQQHCVCVNGSFDAGSRMCRGSPATCDETSFCLRRLFSKCLRLTAAISANVSSGQWCDRWGTVAVSVIAEYVALPANYNATLTYQSCAAQLCDQYNTTGTRNVSTCALNPAYSCAFTLETVTLPPGDQGENLIVSLWIPGPFAGVTNPVEVAALRQAVTSDLAEVIPGAVILSVTISSNTSAARRSTELFLVVFFKIRLPSNDATMRTQTMSLVVELSKTKAWLAATSGVFESIVPGGMLGLPFVEFTVQAPASKADCDSTCIMALVIVGVGIVVIAALLCLFCCSRGHAQVKPSERGLRYTANIDG